MNKNIPPSACPFCTLSGSISYLETHVDYNGTSYDLFTCGDCDAEWWNPLKNPGAAWYESDEKYAGRNIDPILKPNEKHRDTLSFLGSKTGRVLDVGCGVGNFLTLAKANGWECWGIDFDRDSIVTAKRTFGLQNLEAIDLTTFIANHPHEHFDLVTFFDVFEHIDNHNEFIDQVKTILNGGGHIALSVPYRHSWRWLVPHDWPPRHLTRWDIPSITTFLERNGFTVSKVWKLPASWYFLVMKLRWKYGRFVRFGLIKAAKQKAYGDAVEKQKIVPAKQRNLIRTLHVFAKSKDIIIFGIPAFVIWCAQSFSDKRHTDFYLVATLPEAAIKSDKEQRL